MSLARMFRQQHFATRERVYSMLVQALVPYEKIIIDHRVMRNLDLTKIVVPYVWKNLSKHKRKRVLLFIQNNEQTILQHIAELKENKDAVIVHRATEARKKLFDSLATLMAPYKKLLQSELCVPVSILRIVAEHLDIRRLEGQKLLSLQNFLFHNKNEVLKRIHELEVEATKENLKLPPEAKTPDKKNAQGENKVSASLLQNQQGDKILDSKVVSPEQSQPLPSRKRYREEEEEEPQSKSRITDDEGRSPSPKRRHLTTDDLDFARWCLREIRPISCARFSTSIDNLKL